MKKKILFILFILFINQNINVYACGEIKELKTDVGTLTTIDSSNYLITIPEGTKEITLTGSTDYEWVDGYAPRKIATNEKAELKVNGNACGYGIYTYFIKFKTLNNIIAENDSNGAPNEISTSTPSEADNNNNTPDANTGTVKLDSLSIEDYDLDFDSNKFNYNIDVDSNVDKLNIMAILPDGSNASFVISENAKSLIEGENEVTITVFDQDSNIVVYTINVNKAKFKSSNNFLASISIGGYQLNFDSNQTTYDLSIKKESTLNISVVTESELAKYEILNNHNLDNGSSIIIRVTAEDGSTKDYVINIKRSFNIMDYSTYIVIGLLVILLILLLLISKQRKKKKNNSTGPATIEGNQNTAGLVQEVTSANDTTATSSVTPVTPAAAASSTSTNIQIIEPTNIENTQTTNEASQEEIIETFSENEANKVDESNSPTEVFKL